MNAIVLAAGRGRRLGEFSNRHPKCLLEFNGTTLLGHHLRQLADTGQIELISIVTGYLAGQVAREAHSVPRDVPVELVHNPRFELGSGLSLLAARAVLESNDCIIMDADLLYGPELLARPLDSRHPNCLLVDGRLEDSGEEVKVVARPDGSVCELGKVISDQARPIGESVGVFRFQRTVATLLVGLLQRLTERDPNVEYEPAINQLLGHAQVGFERVDDLPWIEIDFEADVERARTVVAPQLRLA